MSPKRATVPVDSVQEDFFVRQKLNDDHVIHLASLYESGVKLPPIIVTADHRVIDGRHRLHALRLLEKKAVDVEYSDAATRGDAVVQALRANLGGALPPTNGDIVGAVALMLEAGMTGAMVGKQFSSVWPPSLIRRYIVDANSRLTQQRITRAKNAVVEGMTVQDAALAHKVKLEILKTAIGGPKAKKRDSAEVKGQLTNIFRSRGGSMGAVMKKVAQRFEDGELSWKTVESILEHCEQLCKNTTTSVRDWRRRLEVKAGKEPTV